MHGVHAISKAITRFSWKLYQLPMVIGNLIRMWSSSFLSRPHAIWFIITHIHFGFGGSHKWNLKTHFTYLHKHEFKSTFLAKKREREQLNSVDNSACQYWLCPGVSLRWKAVSADSCSLSFHVPLIIFTYFWFITDSQGSYEYRTYEWIQFFTDFPTPFTN